MKKILIVEDEAGNLKTIIEYLTSESQPYEIISAGNGHLACQIAEAEIPDLIIMDWELPVLNGIEATRQLKINPITSAIPVIMCTGVMMTSSDLQTAFQAGAIDFIRKPIDRIELTARVRSMLMLTEYFTGKKRAESKVNELSLEIQEQKIARLQMELEFKKKELTSKAMFLIQKDEMINQAINQLLKIQQVNSEEKNAYLSTLIRNLQISLNDKRWNEFEVAFEQVHEDFYTRLKMTYPLLSPNEKKLCAFIRLNLSIKEIGTLTGQTLKSIEVARTRLRRKLKLERDENLNSFIAGI